MKFAVVAGRFNELVTESLIGGALDCLERHGVSKGDITLYRVPGSFEIPQGVQKVASTQVDAVICVGALIRGDTPHFDILASQVVKDISSIGVSSVKLQRVTWSPEHDEEAKRVLWLAQLTVRINHKQLTTS